MCPKVAVDEVAALTKQRQSVSLVEIAGQCYALKEGLEATSPPWDRARYDILVAVPSAYDACSLDGFYLALPYSFNGGEHPRVNGATISFENQQWRLVSWHYPDGRPWTRGQDDLATHFEHCRGFFLHRGAANDFR